MSIESVDVRVACDKCGHDELFTDYPFIMRRFGNIRKSGRED